MYSHISKYQDQEHKLTEVYCCDKSEMLDQTSLRIKPRTWTNWTYRDKSFSVLKNKKYHCRFLCIQLLNLTLKKNIWLNNETWELKTQCRLDTCFQQTETKYQNNLFLNDCLAVSDSTWCENRAHIRLISNILGWLSSWNNAETINKRPSNCYTTWSQQPNNWKVCFSPSFDLSSHQQWTFGETGAAFCPQRQSDGWALSNISIRFYLDSAVNTATVCAGLSCFPL